MPTDFIAKSAGTVFQSFADVANSLIPQLGSLGQIQRVAATGAYDPISGHRTAPVPEIFPAWAVLSQWDFKRQPTRPVAEGTLRFIFPAQMMSVIPNGLIDTFIWAGARYRFVSGQIVAPGSIPIVFDMECSGLPSSSSVQNAPLQFKMTSTGDTSALSGLSG